MVMTKIDLNLYEPKYNMLAKATLNLVYVSKTDPSYTVIEKYSHIDGKLTRIVTNKKDIPISCELEQYEYNSMNNYLSIDKQVYNMVHLHIHNDSKIKTLSLRHGAGEGKILCQLYNMDEIRILSPKKMIYLNYMWIINKMEEIYHRWANSYINDRIINLAWYNSGYASIIPKELKIIIVAMITTQ